MQHHIVDSIMGLVITILFASASLLLNWFTFVNRADKAIMEPLLHIAQLGAALGAILVAAYTLSPRFKKWFNKL